MKIPETEHYVELKTHLRYLNEKIIEAFSRFIAVATAIIAGVYYIHTTLAFEDNRRTGLKFSASAILMLVGIGTIILIITNLRSWHKYREVLSTDFPDIKNKKS